MTDRSDSANMQQGTQSVQDRGQGVIATADDSLRPSMSVPAWYKGGMLCVEGHTPRELKVRIFKFECA